MYPIIITYLIQFILYKTLVDNNFGSFLNEFKDRIEKLEKTIKLTKITRDYNLNTSLKNYIDPRVYKTWSSKVKLDWRTLYSKTLQKKFEWVERTRSGMPEIESDS